jgi:hypothetical protein
LNYLIFNQLWHCWQFDFQSTLALLAEVTLLNPHQPDGQSFHLIERSRWCRRSESATENIGTVPAAH